MQGFRGGRTGILVPVEALVVLAEPLFQVRAGGYRLILRGTGVQASQHAGAGVVVVLSLIAQVEGHQALQVDQAFPGLQRLLARVTLPADGGAKRLYGGVPGAQGASQREIADAKGIVPELQELALVDGLHHPVGVLGVQVLVSHVGDAVFPGRVDQPQLRLPNRPGPGDKHLEDEAGVHPQVVVVESGALQVDRQVFDAQLPAALPGRLGEGGADAFPADRLLQQLDDGLVVAPGQVQAVHLIAVEPLGVVGLHHHGDVARHLSTIQPHSVHHAGDG